MIFNLSVPTKADLNEPINFAGGAVVYESPELLAIMLLAVSAAI